MTILEAAKIINHSETGITPEQLIHNKNNNHQKHQNNKVPVSLDSVG